MKHVFIAGNWKSNKTVAEANEWLSQFKTHILPLRDQMKNLTIVLCAPFTVLASLKWGIATETLPVTLGAQDVSPFEDGAYTGEVSARMIRDLADWVIIGHSERRHYFGDTEEILEKKVAQAKTAGLHIIYCVPDDKTTIPKDVDVVAYEPIWAIGTGKTDTPQNANEVISHIKANSQIHTVIYGGSVTAENVASFMQEPAIDGVLPGGASLDPEKFARLISATYV